MTQILHCLRSRVRNRAALQIAAACFAISAAASCAGDSGTGPEPSPAIASIVVTPGLDTLRSIGDTRQFTAVARDAAGNVIESATFTWTSNGSAATVSADGVATALANGSSSIIASSGDKQGTATLVVRQRAATVTLTPDTLTLAAIGDTARLVAVARDARSNPIGDASITWSALEAGIAAVTPGGLVTAVANGGTRIHAVADGITAVARIGVRQMPSSLAILVQAGGAQSGAPLDTQPVVEVRDARGVRVQQDTSLIVATLAGGSASLSGTTSVRAVNGRATFSNLTITGTTGTYTLSFQAPSVPSVTGRSFVLAAGPASTSQSVVTVSSASVASGATVTVMLQARDASGNPVGSGGLAVTFSTTGGTSTGVFGAVTDHGDGRYSAAFTGQVAGSPTTVRATMGGVQVTSAMPAITVTSGAAATLAVVAIPASGTAGSALSPALAVEARDAAGNVVTSFAAPVEVRVAEGPSTSIGGTLAVAAAAGRATFSDLRLNVSGSYRLMFTSSALPSVTTGTIVISAAQASALDFTTVPTSGRAGEVLSPPVVVRAVDAYGNTAVPPAGPVTVALLANGTGATLGGTTQASFSGNVATFSSLVIDRSGDHRIIASLSGLAPDTTTSIAIASAPAVRVSFVIEPASGARGSPLPAFTVDAVDAFGAQDTSFADTITVALVSGPSATLAGTVAVRASRGRAQFSNVIVNGEGSGFRLTAAAPRLSPDTSAAFSVTPAGTTHIWTGAESTDWNSGGNWSPASMPSTDAVVFVPSGAPRYPVVSSFADAGTVRVAAGATLAVNGRLSIVGTLNAPGGISGSGGIQMRGADAVLDAASIPGLEVTAASTTTLARSVSLSRDLFVSGTLVLGGHRMSVTEGTSVRSTGRIRMTHIADTLEVREAGWESGWSASDVTAGVVIVRGTHFSGGDCSAGGPVGTHLIVMAGTAVQQFAMDCAWRVVFANPDTVRVTGKIRRLARVTAGTVTGGVELRGPYTVIEDVAGGRWHATLDVYSDTLALPDSLSGEAITFRGTTALASSFSHARDVSVTGVLRLNHHRISVGRTFNVHDGARLVMFSAADSVRVAGATYWAATGWNSADLSNGTVIARGSFGGSCGSPPRGDFRLILAGTSLQEASSPCFWNLDITNPDTVILGGSLYGRTRALAGLILDRSGNFNITLEGDSARVEDNGGGRWRGTLWIRANRVWLPDTTTAPIVFADTTYLEKSFTTGGQVHLWGDINLSYPIGHLHLNGHTMTARTVRDNGVLYMNNPADTMRVRAGYGRDLFAATPAGALTAGVMELRGNSGIGGCASSFTPSGSHLINVAGGNLGTGGPGSLYASWCGGDASPVKLWNVRSSGSSDTLTISARGDLEVIGGAVIPAFSTTNIDGVLRLRSGSTLTINGTLNVGSCQVESGATIVLGPGAVNPCASPAPPVAARR